MLADQPEDLEARLVYADWLEGQGLEPRARLLRLSHELAKTSWDDASLLSKSRALLAASRDHEAAWVAAISLPRLEATCWGTRDHDGVPYVIGFLPDGQLLYRRVDERTGGSWGQVGTALRFDINGYSEHVGAIAGQRMRGTAHNPNNGTWSWELRQIDAKFLDAEGPFPELGPEPMDTNYQTGGSRQSGG